MAWIELHQAVRDHRKIVRLAELLDLPEPHVVGHIAYLWLWALDNAPDGQLDCSPRTIARAAWWESDSQQFVDALVDCGLLETNGDGLAIHDWESYAGKLINQRKANAERQAKYRERSRPERDVTPSHEDRNADVTVTSPSRNAATVPNPTEPDPTEPDQERSNAPAREAPPRAKRLPERYEPTAEQMAWAGSECALSPEQTGEETAKFRDHFRANGKAYADWDAAWRNWMRRSVEFRPAVARTGGNGRASPAKPTNADISAANIDAAFGESELSIPGPVYETTWRSRQ